MEAQRCTFSSTPKANKTAPSCPKFRRSDSFKSISGQERNKVKSRPPTQSPAPQKPAAAKPSPTPKVAEPFLLLLRVPQRKERKAIALRNLRTKKPTMLEKEKKSRGLSEQKKKEWCRRSDLNRHGPVKEPQDFKSCASTDFATPARGKNLISSESKGQRQRPTYLSASDILCEFSDE